MSILSHGVDMVDCARLKASIERFGEKFLHRVFTPVEQDYCLGKKNSTQHLAGRFAAKEAVLKVLGTGWRDGIAWTDIEVRNLPSGQPVVSLSGKCREVADEIGLSKILISISHIETHAIASAIGLGLPPSGALGVLGAGG
ncbi:MAG: holo-ACP synthase [Phycisphaerae bacterium]|nr:holo-ACP synthase [Phycisphaerae bacterium]